ncbi:MULTISPECIES: tautomerase family protein [Aeromicrobium]|uniref:tautomerase family protein n=1 Tax=Aeromicrobium TaxID=2040 RepID=UPI0006F8A940|nr:MULTISPECIES: tautomerase family protein [Aeromicrobium]KQX74292.1 tautomerase [Aeromicrobium sp. Root472D3]MCL8249777.1 tautomerase family protein [Aeromicrobium fastidiosum]
MPLVMVDTIRGEYDEPQLRTLLDAVQDAVVEAFDVPASDRYQILTQHEPFELVALDTGLGIERSDRLVMVRLSSKARTQEAKVALYEALARNLADRLDISGNDLVVTINENGDADWSFGHGTAQFLTGDLT